MKKTFILLTLLLSSKFLYSQVGIGTNNPNATLDVVANTSSNVTFDGIIAPRLNGDDLKTKTYTANQTGAIVYVIQPISGENTAQTININTIGYYYFDGNVWLKLMSSNSLPSDPWNVQGTTTPSANNTDNIYQNGSVAIHKNKAREGVDLDILGSIRGAYSGRALFPGVEPDEIGVGSVAFGPLTEATDYGSVAIGSFAKSLSAGAVAIGSGVGGGTIASGPNSVALGYDAESIGNQSTSIGINSRSLGDASFALGYYTSTSSKDETVMGRYNAILSGDLKNFVDTDPLFQIGSGLGIKQNSKNALTILKSGDVGIGISGQEAAAKPTARLDIGSGNLRIRDINTNVGSASDKLVVVGPDGVLKTISNTLAVANSKNANSKNANSTDQNMVVISNLTLDSSKTGAQKTDLYSEYVNYLNGNSSETTNGIIKSDGAPTFSSIQNREDLYYYVTNYDKNVLKNVHLDSKGILTYRIDKTDAQSSPINITIVKK